MEKLEKIRIQAVIRCIMVESVTVLQERVRNGMRLLNLLLQMEVEKITHLYGGFLVKKNWKNIHLKQK